MESDDAATALFLVTRDAIFFHKEPSRDELNDMLIVPTLGYGEGRKHRCFQKENRVPRDHAYFTHSLRVSMQHFFKLMMMKMLRLFAGSLNKEILEREVTS